jgi:hypothetical protein
MGNSYAKAVEQELTHDPEKHALGLCWVGTGSSEKIMLEQRDIVRRTLEEKSSQVGKPVAKMPLRSQMKLKRAICPEF